MGSIGEAFTQTVPSVGASGTTYASTINAILTEVMSRLSTRVPVGSIAAATAALDMNNNAVKNQSYAGFYDQAVVPSGAPFGRIVYANDEFYAVTPSGTVQITDGGAIDVSSTGVIGGDYGGSDPALVEFDAAVETYTFWDDGGASEYAIIAARQLDLVDEASGEVVSVIPSTTATTYTLTLPPNDPASGVSLLSLNSSGAMALAESAAITNPFTADVRHGAIEMNMTMRGSSGGDDFVSVVGTPAFNTTGFYWGGVAENVFTLDFPLPPIPVGRRLTGCKARIDQPAASTVTITAYSITDGGAPSSLGSASTVTVGAPTTVTLGGLTDTVTFGKTYKIRVAFTGGGAGLNRKLLSMSYSYDYPA